MVVGGLDIVVSLSNGKKLKVCTYNMQEFEVHAAAINWSARTNEFTAQSLCNYINSKRKKGLTYHYAAVNHELLQKQIDQ